LEDGSSLKAESIEPSPKTERASVKFKETLRPGTKAQLGLRFGAKLTGSLLGVYYDRIPQLNQVDKSFQYYYSTYKGNGVEKHYTLTQFEVSDSPFDRFTILKHLSQPLQEDCSLAGMSLY
jgi:hypothetical protein